MFELVSFIVVVGLLFLCIARIFKIKLAEGDRNSMKIRRYPKAGYFGGICAGIAYKLRIPAWVVRCALALAVIILPKFGSLLLLLVYPILWIVVPKADTPEDYEKVCK